MQKTNQVRDQILLPIPAELAEELGLDAFSTIQYDEISDILSQSHSLSLLKKQGAVDSDVFISMSNQLAEQLRSAKQRKQKLQNQEEDQTIAQTECLIETLAAGPEFLDTFDEELFCELIDKIIVDSNTKIRFRLKNGLELPESIERTVR